MRKYWKRIGQHLERDAKQPGGDHHWVVLMTLVKASAGCIPFDEFCDAYKYAFTRDAMGYLNRGKFYLSDHSSYSERSIMSIRLSRSIWSLLKKFPFDISECPIDRKAAGVSKLLEAERQCADTNAKLRALSVSDIPSFIWAAKKLIAGVLGDCRSNVISILDMARPGKGSTVSNKGGRVTPYYKFGDMPYSCTRTAAPYALTMILRDPHWWEILENSGRRKDIPFNVWPHGNMSIAQSQMKLFCDCVDFVERDIIQFVPKDAWTDRPMAVGASLNMLLQLGVNSFLTAKLAAVGVYLKDQQRNQRLAQIGSIFTPLDDPLAEHQFSTIDLASASDTIAFELVRLLLPSDWFAFLCDLRHESGELDGTELLYEKFSAMGNGFTFPLESLIFWAVSKAAQEVCGMPCTNRDIAVYGDDIIVREYAADSAIEALEWCGFTVNREKSFITGCFKESCGADFWDGVNIRPIHLKRILDEKGLYYLANRISDVVCYGPGFPGLVEMYSECVRLLGAGKSFGPLTGDASLSIPEDYLSVPLQTLRHPGLRPWLSHEEITYLISRRAFPTDPHRRNYSPMVPSLRSDNGILSCTDPIVLYKTDVPASFTGKGSIRYYIALRQNAGLGVRAEFWSSVEDLLHIEATGCGQVTRRGSLKTVWRARSVSRWNGNHAQDIQARHPANWVDLAG